MQVLANRFESAKVLPMPWVERIFLRLSTLYGSKLSQMWATVPQEQMREVWAEELAGFTAEEIAAGLTACKLREWPPTLPEFLRLCRPLMASEPAYYEAVKGMVARNRGEVGKWSHPAIYWAAVALGAQMLLSSTYGSVKAVWDKAFGEEMAKGEWAAIPQPAAYLPAPGQTQATKEEAEAALKRMGATKMLDPQHTAPRRWIEKLEKRIASGHTPSFAIMQMLKNAKEKTA